MKRYKNYRANRALRSKLEKEGFSKIKIVNGEVVSNISPEKPKKAEEPKKTEKPKKSPATKKRSGRKNVRKTEKAS